MDRRIRIVFFGGADLQPGARRFVAMLEAHPDIDLVLGLCEGRGGAFIDLWHRRGIWAVPVRGFVGIGECLQFLRRPREWLRQRRLANRALARFVMVQDLHAPDVLERLRSLAPDLGVIYGGPILKPELFGIPACGTIGIHHGRAPQYRGKKTTFWEMYNEETTAGITVQRIASGLDTGDVAASGEVEIGRKGYSRVWREVEEEGCRLLIEVILDVRAGRAHFVPQSGARGPLYRQPSAGTLLRFSLRRLLKRPQPGSQP